MKSIQIKITGNGYDLYAIVIDAGWEARDPSIMMYHLMTLTASHPAPNRAGHEDRFRKNL